MSRRRYLAEVWTGDQWLTLGIYASERSAHRRIAQSKSRQEHQVRILPPGEYWHEDNLAHRTAAERRQIREDY